ncbi:bacteriohemerythrin [Phenylobacterium montanum]|uniref:Hemerythrin family protein n=1 Tax=Phenylobacterium montanum TaxID=2823693 RepID=A0A975FVN8_9CAUL|nr:hemerythrin family protein [Caulobacter sp. S6]QUD86134.1 hemerythrin family protein [Caulobacter sp. S6]
MPIMTWDASLDIGVTAMNREHQEILDAMNRIYDAKAQGVSGSAVNDMVARLGSVCVRHFADEEAYMKQVGYPELQRHIQLHARLLDQFSGHAAAIKAAGGAPNDEFFHFLKFWLTSHIKGIDIKYSEHARAQGVA